MILNNFDCVFLRALGIKMDGCCFYVQKDNETMKLLAKSKIEPRKTGEVTDFFDGTSSNTVYTSSDYVLNVTNKQNGKQEMRELRVVNNNMLYTMRQTFGGFNDIKEVIVTAGEYDKDDQVIIKVRFKDKYQPDVFMKTYIMRPALDYASPCYIDSTRNSSKLFDVGGLDGDYREEPVTGLNQATSNDYLFLLKECIDYYYLFPDNLKDFFRSMLLLFDWLYEHADRIYEEKDPLDNPDISELRRKIDGYEIRMNRKFKEALKKRLEDPNLSEIEKLDIKRQYDRWLKEFQQELQIDVRTIFELPCEEDEIQRNK